MSTLDQNQTVTSQNDEYLEVKIIDQKFQDIKNRLKEQGSETSTQKVLQFNKDYSMESVSPFERKDQNEQFQSFYAGAASKYKSDFSDKNILSEVNINVQQNENNIEQFRKSIEKQGKENHNRLPSYASSMNQVSVISENAEYQKNNDDDHVSVKNRQSVNSKISSTYVIFPQKEDTQSNTSLFKVQRDVPNQFKNYAHSRSNSRKDGMLSFSNNEDNITRYNYMNEAQSLFKDEDSKQFLCETDRFSQFQHNTQTMKFSKILAQDEIKVLDQDAKQEYILFLKHEINLELKQEFKFKQMQEEIQLLNKNYRLEKELQQTEYDNRKLQIWILEDKIQEIEQEFQSKTDEKNVFDDQVEDLRQKIVQNNQLSKDRENLINQTKIQIQNEQDDSIQKNEKNKNLQDEKHYLKNELEKERQNLQQKVLLYNERQETFDNYLNLQQEKDIQIQRLQQKLQQKETKIFGCKKDMRRIQDDIVEANEIKSTIKEEQDMYETQLCFLKKQKLIFERDIENLKKKKKFEEEFIHYGDKNNNHLFEQIKQNRLYFENQKDQKSKVDQDISDLTLNIRQAGKQLLLIQQYIDQIEQNINQIIEVTKQGDELFKNQEHYEQIRQTLFSLLKKNEPNINEQLQISKNKNSNSFHSSNLIDQQSSNLTKVSTHNRHQSKNENQLSITNIKQSILQQQEAQNFDENQNEEQQYTQRVFSDRAVSQTDIERQNCFGFMGLGKILNEDQKKFFNIELDDQTSQKTDGGVENFANAKNDNRCKQNHQILNLNKIDQLSKIESQQKLQSPFTIRSMLTSQNGAFQDNKQYIKDNSIKNMDMPLQKASFKQPPQQVPQKTYDLKSFLTKSQIYSETEKLDKINENFQKDRLSLVNQIRDCSPLKQNLPLQNFKKVQQKNLKKQTKSKDEKTQQKYFIDDFENNKFMEIQYKNEQLKKGEIKQIIYLNDDFFNQNICDKPAQQVNMIKNKNNVSQKQQKFTVENFLSQRENMFHNQKADIHSKNEAHFVQSENQKKKGFNYQSFQSKQEYEDFISFQNQFYPSKTDFKDIKNQKEYVYIKAEPFKRKLNYDHFYQEQNLNIQRDANYTQRMFNRSKNAQSQLSSKTNEKKAVFQEIKPSQSGLFIQQQRNQQNASLKRYIADQGFSQKKIVTDSKIDSFREKPPVYNQLNKKVLSSSQVETQLKYENQKCEQIKIAPLRKSITKRRDDSFNVSRKSDPQSINNISSSHFSSINKHIIKFQSRKNTPNYDQISIQSQQPVPIPPIQTQKSSIIQKLQNNDDNLSKYNNMYDQFINKEIQASQLSTRSHYVAKPKNDLHKQSFNEVTSYDNYKGNVNSDYLKRKSFTLNDGKVEIKSSQENNITFKNSTSDYSLNKINVNNPVNTIQSNHTQNKVLNQINLNLKSNFAKKKMENYCAQNTEIQNDKKNLFSQRTENKNQHLHQYENTSNYNQKQQYNHIGLKVNTQTQSQSSIQNNSYHQDILKQDHEFSLMHKDQNYKQYDPTNNIVNSKYQNENFEKYFKISSPEQKQNNQTIQAFTPYYQNNMTQSHFASVEQQIADKVFPSISKCPIIINDQIETKQVQNNYGNNQTFVKSQLQFKSNFAKTKFDQILESQKIYEDLQNINQEQKTPVKEMKTINSSPNGVQNSRQSKLSQFLKPSTYQIDDSSNFNNDQKYQNQTQLEKMQQELKILQAQIGDGIVSQITNSPKESQSVLVGNLKKREKIENESCYDRSDLYVEKIDINSQKHVVGPGIDFLIKDQTHSYHNIGDYSRKDSQSDITTKTYQTKAIQDQQYIVQDLNIKVTGGSITGKSVNNTYIELTDKRNLQNTVEELSEEQLRSQSDEKYSNYENDQDNTYLSLKDQADIISQLRTCKNKF